VCASIENKRRNLKHKLIKPVRNTTQSAMSGPFSKGFCAKEFCSLKLMNLSVYLSILSHQPLAPDTTAFTHTRSNFRNCLHTFILHLHEPSLLLPHTGR